MNTRTYLAVAALAAALLAALSATTGRSAGETSELIAFSRPDGIYAIHADGSGERPLIRRGAASGANRLAWAPDGRTLAFSNGKNEIWAVEADGSHLVRLVSRADIAATPFGPLTWSTDGHKVAFTAFQRSPSGVDWEIWVVDAQGTNVQRLRKTPQLWELEVDWSPAGDRIAFTEKHRASLSSPLRLMTTNGKTLRSISPGSAYQTAMPDWAPDGRRLAFIKWPNVTGDWLPRETEIWVTTPSGGARRLTRNTVSDTSPAWSPDGRKIVFVRGSDHILPGPEKRSPAEIYVMNADGTGVTRLTQNQVGEGSPAWQPGASS